MSRVKKAGKARRVATAAAMLAGMAVPVGAGVAAVAPGVAHATDNYCGQANNDYVNADVGYWLTDSVQSSPYNDVMAYDGDEGSGEGGPLYVGTSPTGSYYYYGKWDICWTTQGTNSTGYYGIASIENEATSNDWGTFADGGYYNTVFANPDAQGDTTWDFQCNGSTIYLYNASKSGYWTSFANPFDTYFANAEYLQNTDSSLQDTFTEVGTSPRFC